MFNIKKILTSILLLSSSAYVSASNLDSICSSKEIVISGFTKHFKNNGRYAQEFGYNEINPGIGFACGVDKIASWNESVEIGAGRNSYRKESLYISYNITYPIHDRVEVGVRLIAANGYKQLSLSNNGWFAGPLLTTKIHLTDNWNINASLLPTIKSKNASGFVWVTLGYRF